MQIIDVDSHITVVKGLEGTPFQVKVLPDGGQLMEFNRTQMDVAPPQGKMPRPKKPPIDMRTWWDLDRRLEDLDLEGISKQVLIFHTAHVFYGADPKVAVQTARKYNDGLAEMIATCSQPARYLGAAPLPLQDPEAAADEAERAENEPKSTVVVNGTNVRGETVDLPED